jgi:nucleotide-binding universal stress UspA family protein
VNYRKILVAVDASENSSRAVDYVATIVAGSSGFHVELLHVARSPERDCFPDEDSWRTKCESEEQKVRTFLAEAKGKLESAMVERGSTGESFIRAEGPGVASGILKVQQEGGFGTVVVGRRGVSKAEEFMFGSVSTKIVHYARDCAVWVIE